MLIWPFLLLPLFGIFLISNYTFFEKVEQNTVYCKYIALVVSSLNLIWSIFIWILFDFGTNQFQFVQTEYNVQLYDVYLGLDGISIYFVLLTTIIMPIALLSNWDSINENIKSYLIIMLLLETLLLGVFLVLDILLFYIFFESILPPLFLFCGIFLAFAVKTPTIFLNNWLLKAHVESPLGGSIVLAGIVLKLSLYGIFRLILPIISKAYMDTSFIVYTIGVITIIYASFSTLRTTDIKELIAYSSVCHAAVYLIGAFSNTMQGIEGSIVLGLAHGFVSSGLFICAGGILYERFGTRIIYSYKGMAQLMPIFSILFFILSLGNCGAPLTLNFVGEFMSLYGIVEKFPILGFFACSSIILSAAYTIYMFNRTSLGGFFTKVLEENVYDVNRKEFILLLTLVLLTIILGIYPALILNTLDYSTVNLVYRL